MSRPPDPGTAAGPGPAADVVVVGAGIGGLTTGALLARAGRRVLVVEAADRVGGYQCRSARDGFEFEPHFHFLQDAGPGRPVRRILDGLGVRLSWRGVDPVLRQVFPDRVVTMPADRDRHLAGLCSTFPGEADGIRALFATTAAIHRAAARLPELSPVLVRHGADTTATFVRRFVRDPRLAAVLGGWSAYFGYGAERISALAIAEFTEACFDGGVLHPVGGITALTGALVEVIGRHGGSVLLSAPVARIDTGPGGVEGVTLTDGRRHRCPVVVSTVDAERTLRELTGRADPRLARIDRFRSPFSVLLGVREDGVRSLAGAAVAVVHPGYDTAAADRAQLAGRIDHAPVSLGVPTLVNPDLAPIGRHIVLLYSFFPAAVVERLAADPVAAADLADRLVTTADRGVPGLRDSVVTRSTGLRAAPAVHLPGTMGALGWAPTPETLLGGSPVAAALRTRAGSALATAAVRAVPRLVSGLAERALPGTSTAVPGLYLAGQWTRTGAGMNNVIRGAEHAATAVLAGRR